MKLVFPENYPYDAPTITFVTQCFHPNVDTHGNICLDTLKVSSKDLQTFFYKNMFIGILG